MRSVNVFFAAVNDILTIVCVGVERVLLLFEDAGLVSGCIEVFDSVDLEGLCPASSHTSDCLEDLLLARALFFCHTSELPDEIR